MKDQYFMRRALELARLGVGWTSPNPMVGAVIVKDDEIVGEGWHQKCGEAHAERHALARCSTSPTGATLYVTLEPCCHKGRTPPCTDAIVESGVARVVVASLDPNPLVAGKGVAALRRAGIDVTEGVLQEEADRLNEVFFHFITTGRPFVVMKYAMTADGKAATRSGTSKWISGPASRLKVQQDRHRYSAIMVGVGTVLADDPLLTCRLPGCKNPLRVICDSHLRTPLSSQVVSTARKVPTLIATICDNEKKQKIFIDAGCQVLCQPPRDGRVDLQSLMAHLGEQQIDSVLLEGGAELNWSALEQGIVTRLHSYVAPKLFGGSNAKTPLGGAGVERPDQAFQLKTLSVTPLGDDVLIESEVMAPVYGTC